MLTSWMTWLAKPQLIAALAAAKAPAPPVGDPLAFYEVAATVLPVLLLALIFQVNFLEKSPQPLVRRFYDKVGKSADDPLTLRLLNFSNALRGSGDAMFTIAVLAFGLVGEVVALNALATRRPTDTSREVIAVGLWLTGMAIVQQAAVRRMQVRAANLGTERAVRTGAVVSLVLELILGLGAMFLLTTG